MDKTCNNCKFNCKFNIVEEDPCFSCYFISKKQPSKWQAEQPTYTREELEKYLIRFCDSIKDYEYESENSIGFDERESEEFVKIFLEKEVNNG